MHAIARMVSVVGSSILVGAGAAQAQGDSPYIRVVDEDSSTVRLDVAVRTLAPTEQDRPLINLVGAIHIGDAGFYDAVQALLDVHDLVLYEGVGGERDAAPEARGDDHAAIVTQRRLRFLAVLAEGARRRTGEHPETPEALAASVGAPMRDLVARALVDGWGRPILFAPGGEPDAVSLGRDGQAGGVDADADLSAQDLMASPRTIATAGESEGLQRDLADALGLVFQMDGIDYS
ncbi:MAG TPA: type II secretion system protein GspG, partial [Phycisphaerales bacterium]|nr:type II secretion system protein GspG [Phycisphaerales bacterium]